MQTKKVTEARKPIRAGKGDLYLDAICKMIESSQMFAEFSRPDIEIIAGYSSIHDVEAGDTVFSEGEKAQNMYLVAKGEIRIMKDSGKETKALTTVKQGQTLGEMSIFDCLPYSASASVEKAARLVSISHSNFERISEIHPQLALKIVKQIARLMSLRLRHTTGTLVDHLN